MSKSRQLHLGAFMRPVSIHTAAWRYPSVYPDANFNLAHMKRFIQTLERGRFDAFFMADHLAVLNMPMNALKRSHTVTSFEPFTLLSALATATDHIGLIATGSTTFDAPFHIARRFASLDHISGGRAAWNIVTTSNPGRGAEFRARRSILNMTSVIAARASSTTWSPGYGTVGQRMRSSAMSRPANSSTPPRMHVLDHKGKYYSVRGPLNIARPIQGWPVIVQAGASEAGRQLAAETAEVMFAGAGNMKGGRELYADVKGRMEKLGRDPRSPEDPAGRVRRGRRFAGRGAGEAGAARQPGALRQRHRVAVDRTRHRRIACSIRTRRCRTSPKPTPAKADASGRCNLARRDNLTVRQLAQRLGGYSRAGVDRHASHDRRPDGGMADDEACDGFNIMFPYLPGGLDDFVDRVVPELQRRGLFRREYEGTTLRENLGLPRPENCFFAS